MSIEQQRYEFIESHGGDLTPEQAAQLLELEEGDTSAAPLDLEAEPDASPKSGEEDPNPGEAKDSGKTAGGGAAPVEESQLTPENTVVLTKDGKHTIEFEKYQNERNGHRYYREQYEAAQAQIARLQAAAQGRADAGLAPTVQDNQLAAAQAAIDQGVDPAIFGDYSEEALAKGLYALVDQRVNAKVEAIVNQKLAPLQQKAEMEEDKAHFRAIYTAHPDTDSIVESKELQDWIRAQPAILHGTYYAILERGTAQDVIEMLDSFKKATGATQAGQPHLDPEQIKAAAKKAVSSAPKSLPSSLTDFPGGRPAGQTRFEQLAEKTDPRELLDAMEDMTLEQREQFLNRLV